MTIRITHRRSFVRRLRVFCILPLLFLLLMSSCNLEPQPSQPTATQDSNAASTYVAQTVQAGSLESTLQAQNALLTAQAATIQALQSPAPSATQELIPSAPPELLPSATLEPSPSPVLPTLTFTPQGAPRITANVDTNCRTGPSSEYPRVGYLLVGQTSTVLGRNHNGTWWFIANPAKPGASCWVWGETTVVTGDTSALPVITPPPLIQMTYKISFANRHDCSGVWVFTFTVLNTGDVLIRSASIQITNKDTDKSYGPDSANSPFVFNPNSCKAGKNALKPGEVGFLITDLGHNLQHGTPVRAAILLCSQEGLKGSCIKSQIDFKVP
jgi:hypothetical protein